MRTLLAIAALVCLQACAQQDDEIGKTTQATTAPVENASLDTIPDSASNGA